MSNKTETDFSQAILEEARQEAERIVDLARREAERIIDGAKTELDKIYLTEAPQAKKQEASIRYAQILASARLETRRQMLLSREQFLQNVQEQVKTRLLQLRADQTTYPRLLHTLVQHGLEELSGEQFEIITAPEDHCLLTNETLAQFQQATGKHVTLSAQTQPGITGAIVRRTDRRVRCDNSLQAILEREQIDIRRLILEHLLGESAE